MNLILSKMRQNQEKLLELKALSSDGRLKAETILDLKPSIEFSSRQYEVVRNLDKNNEKCVRK